ncbi:Hypothetical predicted protein [Olea europaea subsp. europaea]|uniref:Uncharacterized protein n=1 Tax=Olea europaea subsp. europaea TaxID=158383 RepID=A0A8S0SJA0_OLEEU|nr:Hypothetical predicted protein [Olea europaea subsp. europaea]
MPATNDGQASTTESSSAATDSARAATLRKLLDTFLCCVAEFKAVLVMGREPSHFKKTSLDELIPDLLDRSAKALDICNGVELRHWQKLAQIAVTVTLTTLLTSMVLDDKETANTSNHGKQIQAMSSNLAAPRGGESTSLAMPVYIMSTVLVFVMGALVEAIPC